MEVDVAAANCQPPQKVQDNGGKTEDDELVAFYQSHYENTSHLRAA